MGRGNVSVSCELLSYCRVITQSARAHADPYREGIRIHMLHIAAALGWATLRSILSAMLVFSPGI